MQSHVEYDLAHAHSRPGWLIFKTGPSELGVHRTSETYEGATWDSASRSC